MERLDIGNWVLEVDVDATRRAHEQIAHGAAEQCGCPYCRNYMAARRHIYDETVMGLLTTLGVRSDRESDLYDAPSIAGDGRLHYHGWFHAIGRVVHDPWVDGDGPCEPLHAFADHYHICFSPADGLTPSVFAGNDTIEVQFFVDVPWLLPEGAPSLDAPRTWNGQPRAPRSTVPTAPGDAGTADTAGAPTA